MMGDRRVVSLAAGDNPQRVSSLRLQPGVDLTGVMIAGAVAGWMTQLGSITGFRTTTGLAG